MIPIESALSASALPAAAPAFIVVGLVLGLTLISVALVVLRGVTSVVKIVFAAPPISQPTLRLVAGGRPRHRRRRLLLVQEDAEPNGASREQDERRRAA